MKKGGRERLKRPLLKMVIFTFGGTFLILLSALVFLYRGSTSLNRILSDVTENKMEELEITRELEQDLLKLSALLKEAKNETTRDQDKRFYSIWAQVKEDINGIKEITFTSEGKWRSIRNLRTGVGDILELSQVYWKTPSSQSLKVVETAIDRSFEEIKILEGTIRDEIVKATLQAERVEKRANWLSILFAFLSVFSFMGLIFYWRRSLISPILKLHDAVVDFKKGEFIKPVEVRTGNEIEILAEEFNSMASSLYKKIRQLTTLYDVGKAIASTLSKEDLLQKIIKLLKDTFRYDHPSILWLDEKRKVLVLKSSFGYNRVKNGAEIPLGRGVTGRVAQTGKPLLIGDVSKFPDYIPGIADAKSELAVPIKMKGKVVGVINLESPMLNAYTDEDLHLLLALSEFVRVALENAELHEKIKQEAITDPLTGLYNRRYFFLRLSDEFERARRYGILLSVLLLDLKNFKKINDTLGHTEGDKILEKVASVLIDTLRGGDVVCRYGGDEFTVLLPYVSKKQAIQVAMRIHERMTSIELPNIECIKHLDVNIGVATYPEDGDDPDILLRVADEAMYQAKFRNIPVYPPEPKTSPII
jgi:diguanylate cyclase (GGDEF)-like protein